MHSAWAVLYLHLWQVRPYQNFPHYPTKDTICGQILLKIKCMLEFTLHILSGTFYNLRRIQRDIFIDVRKSSCETAVILVRFKFTAVYVTLFFMWHCSVCDTVLYVTLLCMWHCSVCDSAVYVKLLCLSNYCLCDTAL